MPSIGAACSIRLSGEETVARCTTDRTVSVTCRQSVAGRRETRSREEHRSVQGHADTLRQAGLKATALLIQGPIVETTLTEAKRLGADLLIVGSHGFGALYDLVVGSSSRGILKNTEIPVLVVPVKKD